MSLGGKLYDYVVIGGGTTGCIVASRLTEDPDISVLLLEAGPSDVGDDRVVVPGNVVQAHGSNIDWAYKTVPQEHGCLGYRNNVCEWPRGKVLGGSSSINGMAYVRGHAADFDSWAKAGCTGWDWKSVEHYFQISENFISTKPKSASNRSAIDLTTHPFSRTGAARAFIHSGVELGFSEVDINSGQNIGFGDFPAAIDYDGKRSSTATGYLRYAEKRRNLTVLTNTFVCKITIKDKVATGVTVVKDNKRLWCGARNEVIVCAGAINSPQLLMLSGIGPREDLNNAGIECIEDLAVGKNLQDHLQLHLKADVKPGSDVITVEETKPYTNHSEVAAFVKSRLEKQEDWPDFQIQAKSVFYHFGLQAPRMFPLKDSRFFPYMGFDRAIGDVIRREGFTFQIILLHPKSTGEITLKDSNPYSHPVINPRYFEDKRDVDVMVEGIRFSKKLAESKAFKPFGMKFVNLKMPGTIHAEWSDENLADFVRHFATTIYHPVGTCKMGGRNDKSAVVDPQLRVHGMSNLRVIDASVMPYLTSGNTVAPVQMIGEKGADLIRSTYKPVYSRL